MDCEDADGRVGIGCLEGSTTVSFEPAASTVIDVKTVVQRRAKYGKWELGKDV